jgi:hypothetical protein
LPFLFSLPACICIGIAWLLSVGLIFEFDFKVRVFFMTFLNERRIAIAK